MLLREKKCDGTTASPDKRITEPGICTLFFDVINNKGSLTIDWSVGTTSVRSMICCPVHLEGPSRYFAF